MDQFTFGFLVGSAVTAIVGRWIMLAIKDRWKEVNQRAIKKLEQALAKIERLEQQGSADPADWWKQN